MFHGSVVTYELEEEKVGLSCSYTILISIRKIVQDLLFKIEQILSTILSYVLSALIVLVDYLN